MQINALEQDGFHHARRTILISLMFVSIVTGGAQCKFGWRKRHCMQCIPFECATRPRGWLIQPKHKLSCYTNYFCPIQVEEASSFLLWRQSIYSLCSWRHFLSHAFAYVLLSGFARPEIVNEFLHKSCTYIHDVRQCKA